MADFSYLSDTDESAVEEILAEAADHVALKQISAINLSGVSDSVLPQHLETRFRRLKTFPSSLHQTQPSKPLRPSDHANSQPDDKPSPDSALKLTDSARYVVRSDSGPAPAENPDAKSGSKEKSRSGPARSGSPSPSSSSGSSTSWLECNNSSKLKLERGFESGRRTGSVSPPLKKTGCLWWSPGKTWRKKSFGKRSGGEFGGGLDWGGNDDVLEDLEVGWLSRKEREKILKEAAKEEMKINKEAEKIVKWAKQVSARMEAFEVEDDDELPYK